MPPSDGNYLTYLNTGLTVSRLKDSTTGAFGNVLSISFVGAAEEDGPMVVAAILACYRDLLSSATSAFDNDNFQSIIAGRDKMERNLDKANEDLKKVHEQILDVSSLTADELRLRIAANESALRKLENEKIDMEFELSLLQNAIRDRKDKAVVLFF